MSKNISKVRDLREKMGLKAKKFAELLGISAAYLSQIENGVRPASQQVLNKISKIANVDVDELSVAVCKDVARTVLHPVPINRRIPVVGMAAAAMYDPALSQICDLWECSDETVACYLDRDDIFAVRIQGDSMEPALRDGDVVAVDPNTLPSTGDTAIVGLRHDGLVIKRWFWKHGIIRLESLNPNGRTYEWTKNEVFQEGIILWRWKVLALLYRAL